MFSGLNIWYWIANLFALAWVGLLLLSEHLVVSSPCFGMYAATTSKEKVVNLKNNMEGYMGESKDASEAGNYIVVLKSQNVCLKSMYNS